MNNELMEIAHEYGLDPEEAEKIYELCVRKMELCRIQNPAEYIKLLFPDECKNAVFRLYVNLRSLENACGRKGAMQSV